MIKVVNIYKSFGENEVLKGITTEFFQGKVNQVIGRSGSGKSVLLKLIVGLLKPEKGEIYYNNVNFLELSNKELRALRMKIGMLFQASALFDSMTVEQNVSFPLDMFTNMTRKEKLNRVNYCLERVNLEKVNDKFPSEISGGMQKRVGIARAIVLEPEYLFCDEPNSGLDPKTALTIDELIRDITEEKNTTTIVNTHDMNSVMEHGDNVVLLHQGHLAWRGHRSEVLASDNQVLQEFIFASPFLERLRKAALEQEKH
jgi:phospholipid/cholesterol/gamma-HCH transport system ATP-binding protein